MSLYFIKSYQHLKANMCRMFFCHHSIFFFLLFWQHKVWFAEKLNNSVDTFKHSSWVTTSFSGTKVRNCQILHRLHLKSVTPLSGHYSSEEKICSIKISCWHPWCNSVLWTWWYISTKVFKKNKKNFKKTYCWIVHLTSWKCISLFFIIISLFISLLVSPNR